MNSKTCIFQYTTDYEQGALDEIKLQLEAVGCTVLDIEIYGATRACRNAYGKSLSEEEFESIDPESDAAWFDDYDFLVKAEFFHPEIEKDEILFELVNANVDNFLGTEEEYLEDYELEK